MAGRIPGEPQVPYELATRARRFPLQLGILYRLRGEREWRRGTTANLSCSGVLFAAEGPLPVRSPVQLGLVFVKGASRPQVLCEGEVVRCEPGSGELAARIRRYRFVGGATQKV